MSSELSSATMLDHLLVQLSAVSNQMARGFVLHGGRAHDAHPVTLTMQPGAQVGDQLDGIQPVRLRTSLVAFHRDARGIDHITVDAA